MLCYHESEKDQINLDRQPLLGDSKLTKLMQKEVHPIYVNECYMKVTNAFGNTYNKFDEMAYLDENQNVEALIRTDAQLNLCGLFVVAFDTKRGNVIEWQIPASLNLDNVEFKAMASGFHLMDMDVVYFCKDDMYSMAVFGILRSNDSSERNVRMKSVGVMAKSFKSLKRYVPFLKNQIKILLENPGSYNNLIDLWSHRSLQDEIDNAANEVQMMPVKRVSYVSNEVPFLNKLFSRPNSKSQKQLDVLSSDRIYTKFALYFGPSLFSVWRCVLLSKRILFFSSPPIGNLCYRVYCASQLGNTSFNFASSKQLLKPFFYVNVMDIEALQAEPFYLACTSEKILLSKEQMFDIYADDSNLKAVLTENQKNLLKVTSGDKKRFDLLIKHLNKNVDNNTDEESFLSFFTELNDQMFSCLFELENSDLNYYTEKRKDHSNGSCIPKRRQPSEPVELPKIVHNDVIRKAGLDPSDDREFLNEIIRFYDFNLRIL